MRFACALFSFFALSGVAFAQPVVSSEQMTREIEKIRTRVVSTQSEISTLKAQFEALTKERKGHDSALAKLKEDQRRTEVRLRRLLDERSGLEAAVNVAEARLARGREEVIERLKALYMSSDVQLPSELLWRVSTVERERTAVYIRSVRKADDTKILEFTKALDELAEHRKALNASVVAEETLIAESQSRQQTVEGELQKLKKVVDQISAQKRAAEKALSKLQAEALRLDRIIASITSAEVEVAPAKVDAPAPPQGETLDLNPDPAPTTRPESRAAVESSQVRTVSAVVSLPPGGLFVKGAKLSAPVKGKVLQVFGKVKVTDFSDMIFSKGLEYAAAPAGNIHAVYPGKVAYVGSMPGYDTVVVLDHGERTYTLYGRLGKSLVNVGELIGRDHVVGMTSETDAKGRNFYFEVRKSGAPVDPKTVLSRTSR